MAKKRTAQERQMYADFADENPNCWACWIHESKVWPQMDPAHIIGGSGRTHDKRNLLSLCPRCHGLAHHRIYRGDDGELLPHLEIGHRLFLKYEHCWLDLDYLQSLSIRRLPELEKLPQFFVDERGRNGYN